MNSQSFPSVHPFGSDEGFDALLPLKIKKLSSIHWTPFEVAKRVAQFLVQHEKSRILDIGSGVGKFCLTAATVSSGHFTGVEQRESLVRLSRKIAQKYQISRAEFVHANVLTIDFKHYDAFYFFNSFQENLDPNNRIDDDVNYNPSRYTAYNQYLIEQFGLLPQGARIASYCSPSSIIPEHYVMVRSEIKGKLKFWEKRY
jgi:SAM-dependent methyltransferase